MLKFIKTSLPLNCKSKSVYMQSEKYRLFAKPVHVLT